MISVEPGMLHYQLHSILYLFTFNCFRRVNRKSSLAIHMARHNENPIACTICGKELLNRDSLRKHTMRLHAEIKQGCIVCGKTFIQLQSLKVYDFIFYLLLLIVFLWFLGPHVLAYGPTKSQMPILRQRV